MQTPIPANAVLDIVISGWLGSLGRMAGRLRVEYPGAIYHVKHGGDRRELIFRDEQDRRCSMTMLAEACGKTGWQVHALCLMSNHF